MANDWPNPNHPPTHGGDPTRPKPRIWPWLLGAIALFTVVLVGVAAASGNNNRHVTPTMTTLHTPDPGTRPTTAAKTKPANPRIHGDDIVHIGYDVPVGTYRTVTNVESTCYWLKSRDAEGTNIIDNSIPTGGRPQVTLKKGQWFTSQGCPDWAPVA